MVHSPTPTPWAAGPLGPLPTMCSVNRWLALNNNQLVGTLPSLWGLTKSVAHVMLGALAMGPVNQIVCRLSLMCLASVDKQFGYPRHLQQQPPQ
jgi:hypothetical protein